MAERYFNSKLRLAGALLAAGMAVGIATGAEAYAVHLDRDSSTLAPNQSEDALNSQELLEAELYPLVGGAVLGAAGLVGGAYAVNDFIASRRRRDN